MNRSERRNAQRAKPGYKRKSLEEQRRDLHRNGITTQDLAREFVRGWEAGREDTAGFFMRSVYAAMALAMKRELGFDRERTLHVIYAADRIIVEELTSDDIIRRVSRECGIDMYFEVKEKGEDIFEIAE